MQLVSATVLAGAVICGLNQAGNSVSRGIKAGATKVSGSMPNVASASLGRFLEPAHQLSAAAEGAVDLADRGWPWPFMRPATK